MHQEHGLIILEIIIHTAGDSGYCKALARSQYPGYICRNPLMCAPDETNKVLDQIIQSRATFNKCMYQKGYDYK